MEKKFKLVEYFEDVETTEEHSGYFYSVGEALTIVKREEMNKILEETMFKILGNSFLEILNERAEKNIRRAIEQELEQGLALVAKKMILRNDDFSSISEITGLSLQKLQNLKVEISNDRAGLVTA